MISPFPSFFRNVVEADTFKFQIDSESTLKTQGSYALKGIARPDSLNKTLTKTIVSPINLTGVKTLKFDIRASRTGSNIKIGIHDVGGTTTEVTPNIISANTFQRAYLDLSSVSNTNKDVIDKIIITIINADAENTFYIDNFKILKYTNAIVIN